MCPWPAWWVLWPRWYPLAGGVFWLSQGLAVVRGWVVGCGVAFPCRAIVAVCAARLKVDTGGGPSACRVFHLDPLRSAGALGGCGERRCCGPGPFRGRPQGPKPPMVIRGAQRTRCAHPRPPLRTRGQGLNPTHQVSAPRAPPANPVVEQGVTGEGSDPPPRATNGACDDPRRGFRQHLRRWSCPW